MAFSLRSSRRRFADYRAKLAERRKKRNAAASGDAQIPAPEHAHGPVDRKRKPRSRSFLTLLVAFWGLLRGYQKTLIAVLITLSISTLLGLVPLYGTKIVFDNVLREQASPPHLPRMFQWVHLPQGRRELLTLVAVSMV